MIRLLVTRDLTVRYKRSVLGIWWTLLNPLLTAAVMFLVFGALFKGRFATGEPYVVYLLSGVLFMTFFSQGVLATGAAITGSSGILSKVYVPAEVFAFATAVAALTNFVLSLLPMLIVQLIMAPATFSWMYLLVPIPAVAMLALVTGIGLLIASAAVFFYDVLDLSRVGVMLVTYLTPIFWPISIIPDRFQPFLRLNPLYSYLEVFRGFAYRQEFAPWWAFAIMLGTALGFLTLGVWVFSKSWKQLVGYM